MTEPLRLPAIEDLRDAATRIAPFAVRTPLLESAFLNERLGTRVLLKAEVLQRTGSFKFRGAYNTISRIDAKVYPGGVVACSSGNHAQGVAEAARLCGIPAVIVMPADAPAIKVARTKRSGAEVVHFDRFSEDREAIAAAIAKERGAQYVAPFDNFHVIAGQGTAGLELAEQAKAAGADLEAVFVPVSGGGLAAGVALAMAEAMPECRVHSVEPRGFDDYARSLKSGQRELNAPGAKSVLDSLLIHQPGELTFAINRDRLGAGVVVTDAQALAAVAFAFNELKLVVEPGGAAALAGLLSGEYKLSGKPVAVVLSGGNIDPDILADALAMDAA
ncbi:MULTISPECIES: threonine/serine dehydratase [Rhodomicrobium]|uniref:threonine ammonia-lyase n=1 Tax=Rhodomicrobium TaxID=1068 RepID=UPI000B4B63C1|nr:MULTISPECIES: threonine/serine dehydratase [Rhodomicrobium]